MLQIIIEGESVEVLKEKLTSMASLFGAAIGSNPVAPTNSKPSKRGSVRFGNSPPVIENPPKDETSPAEKPKPKEPPLGIPKEEVIEALQQVNVTKGLLAAKEILVKFGCSRISDIKTEDYKAFIAACREAAELK